MMWRVLFSSKAQKQLRKLPLPIKELVVVLVNELRVAGPIQKDWMNFSKLGRKEYHCHLKKGKPTYVMCWRLKDKAMEIMEVYYVGTHEKAPY